MPPSTVRTLSADSTQDRRHQQQTTPRLDGRRASDPTMTTRDVANHLGVTTNFVVGEINEGRLQALMLRRAGKRTLYRISRASFNGYFARHWTVEPTQRG